jgi:CRISPR-associated protein Cas5d
VKGDWAIFTRPELKTERVSYPVMTPSAARGVLEAILWKPAIAWRVERIRVLNPIRFTAFRRNEVNSKAPKPKAAVVTSGGEVPPYFAEDDRAQRNTVALYDVDYVIEAHFALTQRAGEADNVNKFVDIFRRRVEKGQCFHRPYLGCRECAADFEPWEGGAEPIDDTRDLGVMLWDIDYGKKANTPRFFAARLQDGVLEVPEDPEATLAAAQGATP